MSPWRWIKADHSLSAILLHFKGRSCSPPAPQKSTHCVLTKKKNGGKKCCCSNYPVVISSKLLAAKTEACLSSSCSQTGGRWCTSPRPQPFGCWRLVYTLYVLLLHLWPTARFHGGVMRRCDDDCFSGAFIREPYLDLYRFDCVRTGISTDVCALSPR